MLGMTLREKWILPIEDQPRIKVCQYKVCSFTEFTIAIQKRLCEMFFYVEIIVLR